MLEVAPALVNAPQLDGFRGGMRDLGYVEGKNLVIEYRYADGRTEPFAALAAELVRLKVDAIVTRGTPASVTVDLGTVIQSNQKLVLELAAKHRIPAIYASGDFVDAGGLIAYAPNFPDLYRRAAIVVDKVFKGAKPADLPAEQPTKFELSLNAKAAKELGLKIPQVILFRVDRLIE